MTKNVDVSHEQGEGQYCVAGKVGGGPEVTEAEDQEHHGKVERPDPENAAQGETFPTDGSGLLLLDQQDRDDEVGAEHEEDAHAKLAGLRDVLEKGLSKVLVVEEDADEGEEAERV